MGSSEASGSGGDGEGLDFVGSVFPGAEWLPSLSTSDTDRMLCSVRLGTGMTTDTAICGVSMRSSLFDILFLIATFRRMGVDARLLFSVGASSSIPSSSAFLFVTFLALVLFGS